MRADPILIILGAAAATYLPRAMPFWIRLPEELPGGLARFLRAMPVAALGALIFPAVLFSFPDFPAAGLAGVTAAALMARLKGGLVLPVMASIAVSYLVLNLGGAV